MQKVFTTIDSFRAERCKYSPELKFGFVPTMGALHEGHIRLFERARQENDIVVGSIFVNPTQFGPNEDFDKYPKQLERDISLLYEKGLVDAIFAPTREIMYGENHCIYVVPENFENSGEGHVRPGFFRGVATVVCKLFNIIQPDVAYFGQKDAAQCAVVKKLVNDLNFPIEIRIVPTVREQNGLALSSRNAYLSPEERERAQILFQSLQKAQQLWQQAIDLKDHLSREDIIECIQQKLLEEPLVEKIEYVCVGSKETMQEIDEVDKFGAIVSIAVKIGKTRLIDNIVLGPLYLNFYWYLLA